MVNCLTRLFALLMLLTTVSFSNGQTITVTNNVVQPNFSGMGQNWGQNVNYKPNTYGNPSTQEYYSQHELETVIGKRLRETCFDGFFRNFQFNVGWYAPAKDKRTWNNRLFEHYCKGIQLLKDNHIDVIHTSSFDANPAWLGGGKIISDTLLQNEFVKVVADGMEYLIKEKGFTNITAWEITNELSVKGRWAGFYYLGDSARICHQNIIRKVKAAFNERGLGHIDIRVPGVNNDDAWKWGTSNHPEANQTDFHWYIKYGNPAKSWNIGNGTKYALADEFTWEHPREYFSQLDMFKFRVKYARSLGKELCVGEFGPIVYGKASLPEGSSYPGFHYGKTGTPMMAIVFAEQTIALLNAGVKNLQKWCWIDLQFGPASNFYFGSMKDGSQGFQTRPDYYAFGLLNRYIRKNSSVYEVASSDSLIRSAAVKNNGDANWTIATINRNALASSVTFRFEGEPPHKSFRKFIYDPNSWENNRFGDLSGHIKQVSLTGESFTDTIPPNSLVVYTTEYDEEAPAPVAEFVTKATSKGIQLRWKHNAEKDFCYYRIYRGAKKDFTSNSSNQILSTIGNSFFDEHIQGVHYKITAVDKYGNESNASGK